MKLEADRFQRLKYAESAYKTESLPVLGDHQEHSVADHIQFTETETGYG
jgi:hypothetical protein